MLAPSVAAAKLSSSRSPKNRRESAIGSFRIRRKAIRPTITRAARVAAIRSIGKVDGVFAV